MLPDANASFSTSTRLDAIDQGLKLSPHFRLQEGEISSSFRFRSRVVDVALRCVVED